MVRMMLVTIGMCGPRIQHRKFHFVYVVYIYYYIMVRKTRQKPKQQPRQLKTRRVRDRIQPEPESEPEPEPEPAVESHRFVSSITFDGKKLVTQFQKDDEPVNREEYTIEQLEQDIPIGKELVDAHLDGKMPQGLKEYSRRHMKPTFNNVLINPADLGLLPPTDDPAPKQRSLRRRRGRRQGRMQRQRNQTHRNREHMRLMVNDRDPFHRRQPRNLFDLP